VLENMPGGSGSVGCMAVARAGPDGHTLLLASNSHIVLAPLVLTNSPVSVKKDFVPIALMFTFPFLLLVNSGLPVRTVKELVAYAKARPGELNYGSPGVGTGGHLVTELLVKRTGIQAVHVPYQATTQQMLAAAAGTLQFTFDTVGNARGMVDAGKVIPLAVTGARRAVSAPDVPTFKELGYEGFDDLFVANGLLAPSGASPAMIKALNREIVRMNRDGPIRQTLINASYEPGTMTPEEYGAVPTSGGGASRTVARGHAAQEDRFAHPTNASRRPHSDHPADQLQSAVQHHAREPPCVHRTRPGRKPRFLRGGDGPDRERRGRQYDLAARCRGALPPQPHA
jgi:tripartite-type tricarboxylate transporter receptor subunit TctC